MSFTPVQTLQTTGGIAVPFDAVVLLNSDTLWFVFNECYRRTETTHDRREVGGPVKSMSDAAQAGVWLGILGGGVVLCVVLRRLGLAVTHIRDLLHVGAGVWVFGWPYWHSATTPVAITVVATLGLALLPCLARHVGFLAHFKRSVSGADERWSGLFLYALAFGTMTYLAFHAKMLPAAVALIALAIGDGIGGAVGLSLGRHFFQAPGGKRKSIEGSLAVAITASFGAWAASTYFHSPLSLAVFAGTGLVASAAEGLAPKSTDNILIPLSVWLFVSAV